MSSNAGIDVLSTVNVQHLESLNDQIAELSGVRMRETVPDSVLGRADEVVLIDLPPEALIERLRAGKIYPQARIEAALNGFFRIENLSALREVALRQVAEQVEAKRLTTEVVGTRGQDMSGDANQAVGERLLALVEPYPGSQRLVRRAWRSAERLGADLDLLWVKRPGHDPDAAQERALAALRELASVLGARLWIEESDDLAAAVARFARERGSTYILLGRSRPARGLARLRLPLPQRLMEALPGVDVRIVADRSPRAATGARSELRSRSSLIASRRRSPSCAGAGWSRAGVRRGGASTPRAATTASARSCCRSPAARSRAARCRPRCAWPGPRTR